MHRRIWSDIKQSLTSRTTFIYIAMAIPTTKSRLILAPASGVTDVMTLSLHELGAGNVRVSVSVLHLSFRPPLSIAEPYKSQLQNCAGPIYWCSIRLNILQSQQSEAQLPNCFSGRRRSAAGEALSQRP